jgi:putative endonuclease
VTDTRDMRTARAVGTDGEDIVSKSLETEGWELIARNWRTRRGEIDIIARERDTIVFIEVKTWPHGQAADLEFAIGSIKRKRIVETAKCFLNTHRQYNGMYMRFDVVLVDSGLHHLKDAFSERE